MRLLTLISLFGAVLCKRQKYVFQVENTYKSQLVLEDCDVQMPMAYDGTNDQVLRVLPVDSVKACPGEPYSNYNTFQVFDKDIAPVKMVNMGPPDCSINAIAVNPYRRRKGLLTSSTCTSSDSHRRSSSCSCTCSSSSVWPTDCPTVDSTPCSCTSSSSETRPSSSSCTSSSSSSSSCSSETSTSSCTSSTSSSCTSSSCRTSGDPFPCSSEGATSSSSSTCSCRDNAILTTGCPGKVNRIGLPCLDKKCGYCLDRQCGYVTMETSHSGLTYILFETSLTILDRHCNKIGCIENFECPVKKTAAPAPAKEKDLTSEHAHAMILDERHGLLFVLMGDTFTFVYDLNTLQPVRCDFPTDINDETCFRVAPSALRERGVFLFNIIIEDDVISVKYHVATKQFGYQYISGVTKKKKKTMMPLEAPMGEPAKEDGHMMMEKGYLCKPECGWNLVFNDWKNHRDIIVGQTKYGHKLHFVVVSYKSGNYWTQCQNLKIPKKITGSLATFSGAQNDNHLYMSFAPSASMLEVMYTVKRR